MINKTEHFFSPVANALAIISPEETLTYAELAQQSHAYKELLIWQRFSRGERITLLGPNSMGYISWLYGIWQAGMVAVPISTRWPVEMIKKFPHEINSPLLMDLYPEKNEGQFVKGFDFFKNEEKKEHHMQDLQFKFELECDSTILFTSGSNGKPKAVVHSFGNHFFSAEGSAQNIPFTEGDCWLLSLPLYHIGGMAILFRALLNSGAVAVPSPSQSLTEALQEFPISHVSLVATQLRQLLQERRNLSILKRLKAILLGGGPIPRQLIDSALREGLPLYCSYGSTEMSSQITATSIKDSFPQLQTAGSVLPYRELVIAEDSEIRVRGDTLFRGYIQGDTIDPARDSNGWFHTGDLGRIDARGYLTVTGRKDNMFISAGENIQPEEIESVIMQIEEINQVVVVPIAHPKYGKRPVAFIKTQDTRRQDDKMREDRKKKEKRKKKKLPDNKVKEIREYLEKHLPKFKLPDKFLSWPDLDEDMKISRIELRTLAEQILSGKVNK